jgi:hypothetical protein
MKCLHPACYVTDNKYCSTGSGLWLIDTLLPSWQVLKRFHEVILKTKCNLYRLLVSQSHSKQKSISAVVVPVYYIHIHVHTVWGSYFSLHVKYKLCLYDTLSTLWLQFQDIWNVNQLFSCNLHGLHKSEMISFQNETLIRKWKTATI